MTAPVTSRPIDALKPVFECPLSHELMQDPVTERTSVCYGHTFERAWIEAWVAQNPVCPYSRQPLRAEDLLENAQARTACVLLSSSEPLSPEEEASVRKAAADLSSRIPPDSPARITGEERETVARKIKAVFLRSREAFC